MFKEELLERSKRIQLSILKKFVLIMEKYLKMICVTI